MSLELAILTVSLKDSVNDPPVQIGFESIEFDWEGFANHAVCTIAPNQVPSSDRFLSSGSMVGYVNSYGVGNGGVGVFVEFVRCGSARPFDEQIMSDKISVKSLLVDHRYYKGGML